MAKTGSHDTQSKIGNAKMKFVAILLVCVVGSSYAYYIQRELPYSTGQTEAYQLYNALLLDEPSQRLFWGNQGSNSVGGNGGLWSMLTNKFPFLGNWFGRMELQPTYGVPSTQYGAPTNFGVPSTNFGVPPTNYAVPSTNYGVPAYNQFVVPNNQPPQFYFASNRVPFPTGRDVGVTDDAVIITPPNVPINQPIPAPEPAGYSYNKPQNRLQLPHK